MVAVASTTGDFRIMTSGKNCGDRHVIITIHKHVWNAHKYVAI